MMPRRIALLILLLLPFATAQAQGDLEPLTRYIDAPPAPLAKAVTIPRQQMSLDAALHEIALQAGVNLVFSTDLVRSMPTRSVRFDTATAARAIIEILSDTGLEALVTRDLSVVIRREPHRAEDAPRNQTVRGTVTDRATRAPLIGANVVIVGSDPLIGTTTDLDGQFLLPHVPLGRQDIRVSYIGYEAITLPEVLVTSGKEVVVAASLKEQILSGQEIVILPENRKDQPLNEMALVSARSFSVEETRRYAGGLDDPARMASSFAGVATGAGIQENGIIVRGNAPKGVLWRLEGVEIPNPNHFAGLAVMGAGGLTLFSAQLLQDSDFLSGAFPAEYGNALGGVFDIYFRSGNPSKREHTFQLGVIGIDVASEGPFLRGRPSTYLVNYRYSTIGLLMPLLPTEDVARFQDLSFKLTFPTRKSGRFDVWGIGGLDGQSMAANPDSAQWKYETWDRLDMDLALAVGAAGMSHSLVLGDRSFVKTSAAVTVNRTRLDQQRIDDRLDLQDNLYIDNTNGRLVIGSLLSHKFGVRHVNRTGVTLQQLFYHLDLRIAPDDRPPLVPVASGRGSSPLIQAYTQSKFDLTPQVSLQMGVHTQYFALTRSVAIEPRVGLRISREDGRAWSLGYGLHSQIEDLRIYLATTEGDTPNRRLDPARAHHLVVGYDRRLGPNSRIKLEGYYQFLFDVPVIADSSYSLINFQQDWGFRERLINGGAGRNYGAEVTVERSLKAGFYYLASGSVFDSEYRGGDGVMRPTRWDSGYSINALAGREFSFGSNLLGANARVSAIGGLRRSPVDVHSSRAREEVVFDERRAFEVRERGLFLLDVTLTYRLNRRHFSEVWALQVKNVLAAKETQLDYNFQSRRVDAVREGFPLPVLSYKIEF